ncbi:MAG: 3-oxoacyl-ACP reductase FabG [Magnetovibrio sp.]|nr:3-oxoacyl-ACP reductase FabG [Magnetovibrio sp.]
MMNSLNNKVVVVTGGSRGIGRGIALRCAEAGARVALSYSSQKQASDDVVSEIEAAGGQALSMELHVEDRGSIQSALDTVNDTFGGVDVLINNAAISQEKPFLEITDDDWDVMLAINLRGAFSFSQMVLPHMIEKGWGRIINISSIGGQWGGFNQVHYAASKAALISLTQSLAKIYSGEGVTANAIAPGLVATDMAAAELDSDEGQKKVAGIPAGRIGTTTEIADAVVFLASEESGYITGQTLNLNGGMYFS